MTAQEIQDKLLEGQTFRSLAYLVGIDGTDIVQADLPADPDGIWLLVFDRTSNTPDAVVAAYSQNGTKPSTAPTTDQTGATISWSTDATLAKATAVFDTLQNDASWTRNDDGFNFRHDLDTSALTTYGGQTLVLLYTLDANAGTPDHGFIYVKSVLEVKSVLGV